MREMQVEVQFVYSYYFFLFFDPPHCISSFLSSPFVSLISSIHHTYQTQGEHPVSQIQVKDSELSQASSVSSSYSSFFIPLYSFTIQTSMPHGHVPLLSYFFHLSFTMKLLVSYLPRYPKSQKFRRDTVMHVWLISAAVQSQLELQQTIWKKVLVQFCRSKYSVFYEV